MLNGAICREDVGWLYSGTKERGRRPQACGMYACIGGMAFLRGSGGNRV